MRKFQFFLLINLIEFLSAQAPTVPTVGPTDPTTEPPTDAPPTLPPPSIPTAPPATIAPTTAPPFLCPPTGIHQFPTDHCQHFITCINGQRYDNVCQDGYLFDEERVKCEPSGIVDCGTRMRP